MYATTHFLESSNISGPKEVPRHDFHWIDIKSHRSNKWLPPGVPYIRKSNVLWCVCAPKSGNIIVYDVFVPLNQKTSWFKMCLCPYVRKHYVLLFVLCPYVRKLHLLMCLCLYVKHLTFSDVCGPICQKTSCVTMCLCPLGIFLIF